MAKSLRDVPDLNEPATAKSLSEVPDLSEESQAVDLYNLDAAGRPIINAATAMKALEGLDVATGGASIRTFIHDIDQGIAQAFQNAVTNPGEKFVMGRYDEIPTGADIVAKYISDDPNVQTYLGLLVDVGASPGTIHGFLRKAAGIGLQRVARRLGTLKKGKLDAKAFEETKRALVHYGKEDDIFKDAVMIGGDEELGRIAKEAIDTETIEKAAVGAKEGRLDPVLKNLRGDFRKWDRYGLQEITEGGARGKIAESRELADTILLEANKMYPKNKGGLLLIATKLAEDGIAPGQVGSVSGDKFTYAYQYIKDVLESVTSKHTIKDFTKEQLDNVDLMRTKLDEAYDAIKARKEVPDRNKAKVLLDVIKEYAAQGANDIEVNLPQLNSIRRGAHDLKSMANPDKVLTSDKSSIVNAVRLNLQNDLAEVIRTSLKDVNPKMSEAFHNANQTTIRRMRLANLIERVGYKDAMKDISENISRGGNLGSIVGGAAGAIGGGAMVGGFGAGVGALAAAGAGRALGRGMFRPKTQLEMAGEAITKAKGYDPEKLAKGVLGAERFSAQGAAAGGLGRSINERVTDMTPYMEQREPQSNFSGRMLEGIEQEKEEPLAQNLNDLRFPRDTESVMSQWDMFRMKVAQVTDDPANVQMLDALKRKSDEEIRTIMPIFSQQNPDLFEFDPYGRWDGKFIDSEKKRLYFKKELDGNRNMSVFQRAYIKDHVNRTGELP